MHLHRRELDTFLDDYFKDIDVESTIALQYAYDLINMAKILSDSKFLTEALKQLEKAERSFPDEVTYLRRKIEEL